MKPININLFDLLAPMLNKTFPEHDKLFYTRSDVSAYEGNIFFQHFKGKCCEKLMADDFQLIKNVFQKSKTFGFFTDDGFIYYFPAFALYFSQYKDGELMQPFCLRLTPGNSEYSMSRHGEFFACLTCEQISIIKKTLEILNAVWVSWGEPDNGAARALSEFWQYA